VRTGKIRHYWTVIPEFAAKQSQLPPAHIQNIYRMVRSHFSKSPDALFVARTISKVIGPPSKFVLLFTNKTLVH
jgi:hypothetical protein